ncbi:MAG: hypothetical protein ACRDNL_08400, partial [Spirillospora sp.]
MNVRAAVLLLRLHPRSRVAAGTVARAADAGDPVAVRAFAEAAGSPSPLRETLWRAWLAGSARGSRRWSSALLDAPPPSPPDLLVNAAWADWLDEHDDHLRSLLDGWNRPATVADPRVASLSRLARGDGASVAPPVLAEAAARFD